LVTAKSQTVATFVITLVLLLAEYGSVVPDEATEEFAVIVATDTVEARLTTTEMLAEVPEARVVAVQVTDAVIVQDHPDGAATEANVVLAGMASVKVTPVAVAGPLLVTVWV
jgi:hypothetical protein